MKIYYFDVLYKILHTVPSAISLEKKLHKPKINHCSNLCGQLFPGMRKIVRYDVHLNLFIQFDGPKICWEALLNMFIGAKLLYGLVCPSIRHLVTQPSAHSVTQSVNAIGAICQSLSFLSKKMLMK